MTTAPTQPSHRPSSASSSSSTTLPSSGSPAPHSLDSASSQNGASSKPSLIARGGDESTTATGSSETGSAFSSRQTTTPGGFMASIHLNGNIPEFISKLYTLLQNPQNVNIATWSTEGESFLILDNNEFSRSILPQHFKHSNFSSFVRQLNKYDFHKVKNASTSGLSQKGSGEDGPGSSTTEYINIEASGQGKGSQIWEFFHPNFKRDRLDLLALIRRKKTPDTHAFTPRATPNAHPNSNIPQVLMGLSRNRAIFSPTHIAAKPYGGYGSVGAHPTGSSSVQSVPNTNSLMALASSTTSTGSDHDPVSGGQSTSTYFSSAYFPSADQKAKQYAFMEGSTKYPARGYDNNAYSQNSLTKVTEELNEVHEQVGSIAKMQNEMALALQVISKNYQALIDEYCILRRQVSEQDKILRILLASYQHNQFADQKSTTSSFDSQQSAASDESQAPKIIVEKPPFSTSPCAARAAALELQLQVHQDFSGSGTPASILHPSNRSLPTPESPMPSSTSAGNKGQSGLGWRVPPKILLVEDDVICRKLSSRILELFGCSIDVSPDGSDAVEKVTANRYDLVLMDIVMPNMDGLTATKRIRTFNTTTPIISMTSNISQDDCIVYLSTGMNDILPKPFSKDSVLNLLEKYCGRLKGEIS